MEQHLRAHLRSGWLRAWSKPNAPNLIFRVAFHHRMEDRHS